MIQRFSFLLLLFTCLFISACGTKVQPRHSAEKHFQDGERLLDKKLYTEAIAAWQKLRESYYSPELNMLAELKIAETYYLAELYPEAAAAYTEFLKQHPNDSRIDDVLYRLGLCYYQQLRPADRDQSITRSAIVAFEELLLRFPNYPKKEEVRGFIKNGKERLAENELHIGKYYLKKKHYQAALRRLQSVRNNYPDYPYKDEVLFFLGKAYLESGEKAKAEDVFAQLSQQYPLSEYNQDALELFSE